MTESPATRATFYKPKKAFARGAPAVKPHLFLAERDEAYALDVEPGFIPLDLSAHFGTPWPCTTPSLLARYVVLENDAPISAASNSSGDAFYVLRGEGETKIAGERISWSAGDAFCLPGGVSAMHVSHVARALLFQVTDEPLFSHCGAIADCNSRRAIPPTHFSKEGIEEGLNDIHGRRDEDHSAGKCVVFLTPPMADMRLATPNILASINSLEPGGDQRPHQHNSVALTLAVCGDGVYSMVDGQKIDWVKGAAALTPPGAVHSHHNRGTQMMRSFVAQDTGLHTHLQTTDFHWTD